MPVTIAFANQKGGVAKTTSCSNLAYAFAELGYRVLAVDLDPQASLTISMGYDPDTLEDEGATLYHSLVSDQQGEPPRPLSVIRIGGNPALIPSSIMLAGAEQALGRSLTASPQTAVRLRLRELRGDYDIVLVDSPPSLGLLAINALVAADYVLIPTQTEFLSSAGIKLLLRTVAEIQAGLNPELEILGVLPTMHNRTFVANDTVLRGLVSGMAQREIQLYEPIARATVFSRCALGGGPVVLQEPRSEGARAYQKLAREIARDVDLKPAAG